MDGLWATKRESIGLLLSAQLVCKIPNLGLYDSFPLTLQTYTDRQTTCDRKTIVHRAVKISRPNFFHLSWWACLSCGTGTAAPSVPW